MPRLPVDGKKVVEHRITLGTKERDLLQDITTSYRIEALTGKDSLVETLSDSTKLLAALATLGAILEFLGITDVFNFDDELLARTDEIKEKIAEKAKQNVRENIEERMTLEEIIKRILTPGFTPFRAAGFAAETAYETAEDLI